MIPPAYLDLEARLLRWIREGASEDLGDILLAIHDFQRANNSFYEQWCRKLPRATTWREIPAVPQSAFKTVAIRSFPAEETCATFRTSGTTSERYGEHHFRSLELYQAAAIRGWQHMFPTDLEVLSLIPPVREHPHSSLSHMATWLTDSENFYFFRAGPDWSRLEAALAHRDEPCILFGTALAFLDWFERAGSRQISMPQGSLAVETGGYKGTQRSLPKDELYDLFRVHLGLDPNQIVNEYGMTELSSQFYAVGTGTPHVAPPWATALVVDPETGDEVSEGSLGVLRIFDAANLGSACAIQTQDLAIRRASGFELVGRDPNALPRGCSRTADEMALRQW